MKTHLFSSRWTESVAGIYWKQILPESKHGDSSETKPPRVVPKVPHQPTVSRVWNQVWPEPRMRWWNVGLVDTEPTFQRHANWSDHTCECDWRSEGSPQPDDWKSRSRRFWGGWGFWLKLIADWKFYRKFQLGGQISSPHGLLGSFALLSNFHHNSSRSEHSLHQSSATFSEGEKSPFLTSASSAFHLFSAEHQPFVMSQRAIASLPPSASCRLWPTVTSAPF